MCCCRSCVLNQPLIIIIDSSQLTYTTRAGFFLQVPRSAAPLPPGLTPLDDRPRGALHCTTPQLAALNARLRDAARDCLLLSVHVLETLLQTTAEHAGLLTRVVDAVALVDMLGALAAAARDAPEPWTQPRIVATGAPPWQT